MTRHPVPGNRAGHHAVAPLDSVFDRLALRAAPEVIEARLRAFEAQYARRMVPAVTCIAIVFSILAGPMVWGAGGIRLAACVVGGLFLLIPIAKLVARRDAATLVARLHQLPWERAVSWVNDQRGLVLMSEMGVATESPNAFFGMDRITGVTYDAGGHAIRVVTRPVRTGRIDHQENLLLKLPGAVPAGQGEAIADTFHMLWTRQQREPSRAAAEWLKDAGDGRE